MTLGQRIQELRKQKGMSQESLGEVLGVSRQAVSKWEGDNGIPELDTLIAMSRLFGVTIGALLGIEEPLSASTESADGESEKIEAILRRYAEENRAEPPPSRKMQRLWLVVGTFVLVAVMGVLFSQISALRSTVRQLRSQVSSLEVQVSNNLNNLSGQIRDSIYTVLAEQSDLLSTFEWQVVDVDVESQTVTVRLDATMKEYRAGSKAQFLLDWTKTDQSQGKAQSVWVEGPDFTTTLTFPMNYHTEVTIRVTDGDGTVREQKGETLYDLHPDNFQLEVYNLMGIFAITTKGMGVVSTTAKGEYPCLELVTPHPGIIWPEKAVITATVNQEQVFSEEMELNEPYEGSSRFEATIRDGYVDLTLVAGDNLEVRLEVTDNFGRTQGFVKSGSVVYERGVTGLKFPPDPVDE